MVIIFVALSFVFILFSEGSEDYVIMSSDRVGLSLYLPLSQHQINFEPTDSFKKHFSEGGNLKNSDIIIVS